MQLGDIAKENSEVAIGSDLSFDRQHAPNKPQQASMAHQE
jgi:hypothetical protein